MRLRERQHENRAGHPGAGGTDGADAELEGLRASARELLRAGDEAINRVLSGDSVRFLQANRQQGGQ